MGIPGAISSVAARLNFRGYRAALLIGVVAVALAGCAPQATPTRPASEVASSPVATPTAMQPTPTATRLPPDVGERSLEGAQRDFGFSTRGWRTDFNKSSVSLGEIISGGPPKDGIPAIDNPKFESVAEAGRWLADREPVQVVEVNGEPRAYPLQILMWHEIVNDVVSGQPIAVTYCPLCNTALTFEATLADGRVLTFGTTGNLRYSDLVMYDRQTESWWQQATGEAIVGELTGTRLLFIPSFTVSWAEFKQAHPEGKVLSRETGYSRSYGDNPYVGYDTNYPFLYRGPANSQLPPMERIVAVWKNDESVAVLFSALERERVFHGSVGGQEFVVFFRKGTVSALDADTLASGRDVGATGVFVPRAGDKDLTFRVEGEEIKDLETGSTWSLLGEATAGPLKGQRLAPVVHADTFWFAWAAFKPNTRIYRGGDPRPD